jgi:aerobic-type carbon monoxide dehydrogenase small subunit (CoxS/CutS family)
LLLRQRGCVTPLEQRVLIVNGVEVAAASEIDPGERLLDLLRERLGLTGTKEGCGRGECGACTVLVGGAPVLSCITLAGRVRGPVETIEGIGEEASTLAGTLADTGGFQCGFCTPGQIVSAAALLETNPSPARDAIRHAMAGNLCRCGAYPKIEHAIASVGSERS